MGKIGGAGAVAAAPAGRPRPIPVVETALAERLAVPLPEWQTDAVPCLLVRWLKRGKPCGCFTLYGGEMMLRRPHPVEPSPENQDGFQIRRNL